MDWNKVETCDFCAGRGQRLYLESSVPRWYAERPLRLVECTDCGLVYASPRPRADQLYASYLNASENVRQAVQRKLERKNVMDIHRKHVTTAMERLGHPAERLYDMGCGAGTVMMAARELGLEAWGNDVNKAAVDMLREAGFEARLGFSSELDLPGGHFDIVINFDYLEHSFTPMADLRTCFDIVKPGGIMYLKTLYLDCPAHREKGEAWQLFGAGHFYYFTTDVLRRMIEAVGFTIEDVREGQLVFVVARRPAA